MSQLWGDSATDPVTCVRCLLTYDRSDVDRLLWCATCRDSAKARASRVGWMVGLGIAATLAVWIFVFVRPDLLIGGWIATVVAALWIGSKVAREIAYGVDRYQNRPAVEAVPPELTDGS